MEPARVARIGALAAMLGGLAWVVKGSVTIATGQEPDAAFGVALPLFPVALLGLRALLGGRGGRMAAAGAATAWVALAGALVAGAVALVAPDLSPRGEEDVTPLTPAIVAAGFGPIVGLVLLGLDARRAGALGAWRHHPLAMGLAAVPLLALGALLEPWGLFELPVVLLGLGWMALAVPLWRAAPAAAARAS